MPADRPNPSDQKTPSDRPLRLPTRFYGMIVVALAVFFAGLIIGRGPSHGWVVVSEVGCDGPGLGSSDFATAITSDALMQQAIRQASSRSTSPPDGLAAAPNAERIDKVRRQLRLEPIADGEKVRVRISYSGTDPDWSIAFVDELARQYVAAQSQPSEAATATARAIRQARWRAYESGHYERKARFDLDGFLAAHFHSSAPGHSSIPDLGPANGKELNGSQGRAPVGPWKPELQSPPAPRSNVNPQWERLQGELAESVTELDALLVTHTPNHPKVRALTTGMNDKRGQLDRTPKYARSDGGPMGVLPDRAGVKEYARLQEDYERAVQRHGAADRELDALVARQNAEKQQMATTRWIGAEAAITQCAGGGPPASRIVVIGLVALACGAFMAWLIGSLQTLQRFNTLEDVNQVLATPLVGQLSIDPVALSVQRLTHRGRIVRAATTVCEWGLGCLIVVFVIASLDGSPTITLLADDPFGTIAETVSRACQRPFGAT